MCCLVSVFAFASDDLGTVSGVVKFPGESPPRNMFANASDHNCPHGIAQTHLLVKQDSRGLRNAVVILEREDRRVMPTRLQAQLATEGCQLIPRIQWVPLGSSLALLNKDGARHHLHAYQGSATAFEVDLPARHPSRRRPLVVPGLYKINCDQHLWERAWIYVSPHDSVVVTDAQGEFTMKNVPTGRYRIRAWHEGWVQQAKDRDGRLEFRPMQDVRDIRVREDRDTPVIFDTLSPQAAGTSAD